MNEPRSLMDLALLARDRHGGSSARRLASLAQEHGFTLTYTTYAQILNGTYKSMPQDVTLRALAWLAGVSEAEAFTAAGRRVPGPPLADELPPGVDNLSPKARRAVIDLLRVLVEAEESDGRGNAAPMNQPAGDPGGSTPVDELAARRPRPADVAAYDVYSEGMHQRDEIDLAGEDSQDPDDQK